MEKNERHQLKEPPIFCEQCPSLAMALVQDSPLCLKCMAKMVKGHPDQWIVENTRPLEIRPFFSASREAAKHSSGGTNRVA